MIFESPGIANAGAFYCSIVIGVTGGDDHPQSE